MEIVAIDKNKNKKRVYRLVLDYKNQKEKKLIDRALKKNFRKLVEEMFRGRVADC